MALKYQFLALLIIIGIAVMNASAYAQDQKLEQKISRAELFRSTPYPLPRFVSLASEKAYIRTGPGKQYPVKLIFEKKSIPLEVILEYDHWRKIKDIDGDVGWIHTSLLSGGRTAFIRGDALIPGFKKPTQESDLNVYFEPGALVSIDSCGRVWCEVESADYSAFVQKENLWGVYPDEVIED